MKKVFLIATIFCFTHCVFAADWVEITHKSYLDTSSIKIGNDGYINTWEKILNRGDFAPIDGKKVHFFMAYNTYDCKGNRLKTQTLIVYDLNGKVLKSYDYPTNWSYVVPETNGEAFYKIICKYAN